MRKLLSANFMRLKKDKVFWLGICTMFFWATFMLLGEFREAKQNLDQMPILDEFFFQYGYIVGGVCSIFIGLFISRDYSNGTIRNKIIVGHSKLCLYLSNLIVCAAAGFLMSLAWIIAMLCIGIPLFGFFSQPTVAAFYLITTLFMILALTAIFTALAMLISNRATSIVAIFLAFLFVLFLGSYCDNKLHEPEILDGGSSITIQSTDVISNYDAPEKNPEYVSGNSRRLIEFCADFLPTGQGIRIAHFEADNQPLMILWSIIIVVVTTGTGIIIFQKKDLR